MMRHVVGAAALCLALVACSQPAGTSDPVAAGSPGESQEDGVDGYAADGASGAPGGATVGGPATKDEELLGRLADLDLRNEQAILRLLARYGIRAPLRSVPDAQRFFFRLEELQTHDRLAVRRAAVAVMARLPRVAIPKHVDPFSPLFGSDDPVIRREAVFGRSRHGVGAAGAEVARLANDADAEVRAQAVTALGWVQGPAARATLLAALDDGSDEVVCNAGVSLARTVGSGPLPPELLRAAKSSRGRKRWAAAQVFASRRDAVAVQQLKPLTSDPAWDVRAVAIRGLGRVRRSAAGEAKDVLVSIAVDASRPRTDRFEAIQSLRNSARMADSDQLVRVARSDPDPVLRLVAARTVLASGDPRGLPPLVELLRTQVGEIADEEDTDFVRETAESTLRHVTEVTVAVSDYAHWRQALPEILVRMQPNSFSYSPRRLEEFW